MEQLERFFNQDAANEENLFENALCFRLLRHNDLQACMGVGGSINISRNLLTRMEAEGIHVKRYTKYVEFI